MWFVHLSTVTAALKVTSSESEESLTNGSHFTDDFTLIKLLLRKALFRLCCIIGGCSCLIHLLVSVPSLWQPFMIYDEKNGIDRNRRETRERGGGI